MIYTQKYLSPLGGITMASDGKAITGLWFEGQKYFGTGLSENSQEKSLPVFEETIKWLDIYFGGSEPDFMPKLSLTATPFRKAVWNILLTISYGKTMTYGQIAAELARIEGLEKMSAQAVGGAVGHNPISLLVPCHRVVGTNGSLTGYAGGIEKKVKLLSLENTDMTSLFVPKKGTAI